MYAPGATELAFPGLSETATTDVKGSPSNSLLHAAFATAALM